MSTVTITPTVEASTAPDDPPRVRLDIVDTGAPAVLTATVVRRNPNGRLVPVRTGDGNPLALTPTGGGGVGLLYDYEPWYGQPVTYSTLENPATVSPPVTLDERGVWLIHPGVPSLSRPILASGITGRTRPVKRGIHYPLGGEYPVVRTDGQRKAPQYTLTIRSTNEPDRAAIEALFADAGTLLLNVPATKNWGITAEYVSIGDTVEDRLYNYAPEQRRHWTLPILVVDRPIGGSQSQRTLNDLLSFPTLDSLMTAYSTFTELLTGP